MRHNIKTLSNSFEERWWWEEAATKRTARESIIIINNASIAMMGRRKGGVLTVVLTGFDDEEMVRARAIFKRLLNQHFIDASLTSASFCLTRFDASSSSNRSRFSATARPMCARAFFRVVVFPSLEKTKVLCCDWWLSRFERHSLVLIVDISLSLSLSLCCYY